MQHHDHNCPNEESWTSINTPFKFLVVINFKRVEGNNLMDQL